MVENRTAEVDTLTTENEAATAVEAAPVEKKGLRKLHKTKAEKKAEREALSELELEGYVPEEHEPEYKVFVDRGVYRSNYALSVVLISLGIVLLPYSKVGTGLLWFYGAGTAWMVYTAMRLTVYVDGTTFRLEGAGRNKDGEYTFDQVEKITYGYNKKAQRRYKVYKDGHKLFEIAPGSIHGRWLYDDMIAYGIPGGLLQKL